MKNMADESDSEGAVRLTLTIWLRQQCKRKRQRQILERDLIDFGEVTIN
jgi:hypothetical protein